MVFPSIIRSSGLYIHSQVYVRQILLPACQWEWDELCGVPSCSRYQAGSSICLTYTWCCMYSLELRMMGGKTVQNVQSVYSLYPFSVHVVTFIFHYQLMHTKHCHNFHLKLYTLKTFAMRTKTNLKNPTCFDRFADHHQGLVPVPCTITTCQFFCFFAFQLCGGMFSVCARLRRACWCGVWMCTHPDTTLTGTSQVYTYRQHTATDVYTSRHHTDRYITSIYVQKTYHHITGMRRSRKIDK